MIGRTGRLLLALAPALAGCAHEQFFDQTPPAALSTVVPAGGSVGVDPSGAVTISFTKPLRATMEQFAALHEGDFAGVVVAGRWALSADRTALTFTPAAPLARATGYAVHLGGGLKDEDGRVVDLSPGRALGGRWATASMMSQAPPGSPALSMVGIGWLAPNGTYGMIFDFTTF